MSPDFVAGFVGAGIIGFPLHLLVRLFERRSMASDIEILKSQLADVTEDRDESEELRSKWVEFAETVSQEIRGIELSLVNVRRMLNRARPST